MLVFFMVLVAAIVLGSIVYRYDLYNKEPWYLLLMTTGLGMLTGYGSGLIEDQLIQAWNIYDQPMEMAWLAGIVEELAKVLVVVAVAFVCRSKFDDPQDGQIYGAFAGLGAAIIESRVYLTLGTPELATVGTEFARLLLHLLLGGIGGYGIGLARFRIRGWAWKLPVSVTVAVVLHSAWDWACGLPAQLGEITMGPRYIAVGLMLTTLLLFGLMTHLGTQHAAAALKPRRLRTLFGWPFNLIFRSRPEHVSRNDDDAPTEP
ncbi:MAG: PrsW family glutamic-type intramembrane protease [Fuerstiella sp.]|nr:PrsW family glutamic-type intramembrane protease [Fuerstiella sp.]